MPPAFGGIKRTRNMYKWHSTRILVKQKWIRCIHRNIQGGWGAQMKIAPLKEVEPTLRPFGGAYLRYKATTQHICTHLPDNLGYTSECDCVCVSSLRKKRANENSEHCKQRSNWKWHVWSCPLKEVPIAQKQGNAARKDAGCFAIRDFWCASGHVAQLSKGLCHCCICTASCRSIAKGFDWHGLPLTLLLKF